MFEEYDDDDDVIISDDEIILLKPRRIACKCIRCPFMNHTGKLSHFSVEDRGYCCRWCRLSNGKKHGNHCQKVRNLKYVNQYNNNNAGTLTP